LKKALAYSLILHVLLFSAAFFLVQEKEKKGKGTPPFFAKIITPDELKEGDRVPVQPSRPAIKQKPQKASPPKPKAADKLSKAPAPTPSDKGLMPPAARSEAGSRSESFQSPQRPQQGSDIESPPQSSRGQESASPKPQSPLREKLFDKDVIGKLAHKERETPKKPDSSITFDTREFKYYGYMQRLREKIEGIWKYPSEAAERGIYGDLYIRFTIKKNGKLGAVEVVRTSGHKSLDDAALKALKEAEPYWPLPDEWGHEGFTITGHFIYSLQGIYIR
jgi:protein TonB